MFEGFSFSKLLRGYYYLAPVWYVLETYAWPNLRAGPLVGDEGWARLFFYGAETAIGAGMWKGVPYVDKIALSENVVCLINGIKFIVIGPLDIALNVESADFEALGQVYVQAVPGVLYSLIQVCNEVYQKLYGRGFPLSLPPMPGGSAPS